MALTFFYNVDLIFLYELDWINMALYEKSAFD